MLEDRSEDFQVAGLNNIDDKAWHKHLKKLGIRVVSKNELCKTYNDKTTDTITIMLEDPVGLSRSYGDMTEYGIDCWLVIPKEVAEKFLVLGVP